MKDQKGFTLLEFMIAFALLVVVLSAVFITQGSSLMSSTRSSNLIVATNLAKNIINELDLKYEGAAFDRLPEKDEGNFPEPHQDFKWIVTYKTVDFSVMSDLLTKQALGEEGQQQDPNMPTLIKLFEDFMQKSVRRMEVVIEWQENGGTSRESFSQLIVNYDTDFSASI
ncbi:MAG: prepilin-type N-terminal cleavage/methylation domain-containing protein [Oligoflexia bacterium]|nr:prepilin-type N-terminal cleavage/methylation domain-containing protein [Oligoflexia bacterium]